MTRPRDLCTLYNHDDPATKNGPAEAADSPSARGRTPAEAAATGASRRSPSSGASRRDSAAGSAPNVRRRRPEDRLRFALPCHGPDGTLTPDPDGNSERSIQARLLAACSRVVLDDEATASLRQAAAHIEDWDSLIEAAAHQAVLPLLYHHLQHAAPQHVPAEILAKLRAHVFATTAQNLFMSRALADILDLFQARGIRAIPYKGLLIAASAYRNISLRQIGDLDLLVHSGDYGTGRSLLLERGYRLIPEMDLGWECAFRSPDGRVEVDLHQALLPFWFDTGLDFDELWNRCTPIVIAGKSFPNLAPEDALTVLSLQLFKDTVQGKLVLRQVCDIAEVLRQHPELDWPRLLQRTAGLGLRRELHLGLQVARQALAAPLPDTVRTLVQQDRSVQPFVAEAIQQVFLPSRAGEHYWLPFLVRWPVSLKSKLRIFLLGLIQQGAKSTLEWDAVPPGRLQQAHRMLSGLFQLIWMSTTPTEKERELIALPKALSPLYYLIRPIRVGIKHLRMSRLGRLLGFPTSGSRPG